MAIASIVICTAKQILMLMNRHQSTKPVSTATETIIRIHQDPKRWIIFSRCARRHRKNLPHFTSFGNYTITRINCTVWGIFWNCSNPVGRRANSTLSTEVTVELANYRDSNVQHQQKI
ncbi:hypothetical protein HUJ04_011395 [Dendroctonus ponderosae]|nr:hypothetical protein HUJ04_011395 [Dendroctonus ponderosae]